MENRVLLETFASAPRMKILNLLTGTSKSASSIAREVGLSPTAVRFHLQKLLRLDLVEEVEKRGSVGRPRLLYRATGKHVEMAYPARHYAMLSEALLKTISTFEEEEVRKRLRNMGEEIGAGIGKSLVAKTGLRNWDSIAFRQHYLEGMLRDFGAHPEVVRQSAERVQYKQHNCPFKEAAVRYPSMVCDDLDSAVSTAIFRELNPAILWRKLKCMGHGDPYCEYLVSWNAAKHSRTA